MASYKADVAAALKVPVCDDWDIVDEDPQRHLVLAHTSPDGDLAKYGWIKGIVLDTRTWRIVCQSYGSSHVVSLSMTRDLAPVRAYAPGAKEPHEVFRVVTQDGQRLELRTDRLQWSDGHDGTVLRVWKHEGEVFVSSHKRIHIDRATWGGSPRFKELYTSLGGPTDALFGDAPSSRAVYTFMLVHADLQIGSHLPIEKPFLLYLGNHIMEGDGPVDELPAVLEGIATPAALSLAEVNNRLKYGYYTPEQSPHLRTDPRLSHGEFVMCFEYADAERTRIERCVKVQSDAYTWRSAMRDNNPNLEHLVFTVAGIKRRDLRQRADVAAFTNRYPLIELPTKEDIPYLVPRLVPERDAGSRQRQIAVAGVVYATNPSRQGEVLHHFGTYLRALDAVRKWILRLDGAEPDRFAAIEAAGTHGRYVVGRIRNILQVSTSRAAQAPTPEAKAKALEESVRYLVDHEFGESLYKIYKLYSRLDGVHA